MIKAAVTLGVGIACAALALAPYPAEANLLMSGGATGMSNGTGVANVDGSVGTNLNDLIFNLYGGVSSVNGTYYGQVTGGAGGTVSGNFDGFLYLDQSSTLSFQYIASEASFSDAFESPGIATLTTPGSLIPRVDYDSSGVESSGATFAAGNPANSATAIDFSFVKNGGGLIPLGTATNGDPFASFCNDCSIFVVFLDPDTLDPLADQSQGSTVADVFFNDGNRDDNHDDMMIRITATPVPVPAALPIIGAALAGFGFAGFKSRRKAA
jgi:hypothetical protein